MAAYNFSSVYRFGSSSDSAVLPASPKEDEDLRRQVEALLQEAGLLLELKISRRPGAER